MGYRRSRRLRSPTTAIIPADGCLHHLLLSGQPTELREREDQGRCTSPGVSGRRSRSGQWYPEISHHAPGTSILLVGTKLDLREDVATVNKLRDRCVNGSCKYGYSILSHAIQANGTYHLSSRHVHGEGCGSGQIPRVLCIDTEGSQECLRRSHPSSLYVSTLR